MKGGYVRHNTRGATAAARGRGSLAIGLARAYCVGALGVLRADSLRVRSLALGRRGREDERCGADSPPSHTGATSVALLQIAGNMSAKSARQLASERGEGSPLFRAVI